MNEENTKPRRGRPKKSEIQPDVIAHADDVPCPVCVGGWIEIKNEDENGDIVLIREECDFCGGTGTRPKGPFEPDDVSDEDIEAIERALGYTSKAWGFIDERAIIAACANRMGRKPVS